jgi:hypothetical protein
VAAVSYYKSKRELENPLANIRETEMRKSTLLFWMYIAILILTVKVANAQQLNFVLRTNQDVTLQDSQFMTVGWDNASTFIPAPPAPPGNNFYMYIAGTYRFKDIKVFNEGQEYKWDFEFNLPAGEQTHTLYLNNEHNASATDYVLLLDENGSVIQNITYSDKLILTEAMNGRFTLKMLPKGTLDRPVRLVEESVSMEMGSDEGVLDFATIFAAPDMNETTFSVTELTASNTFYTLSESKLIIDWTSTNASVVDFKIEATNAFGTESIVVSFKRTVTTDIEDSNELVDNINLAQNYPNPFNPTTSISFDLPQAMNVNLSVYNMAGQEVATLVNGVQSAGQNNVLFNASNLPSGVYLYRLVTAGTVVTKKMTLIK